MNLTFWGSYYSICIDKFNLLYLSKKKLSANEKEQLEALKLSWELYLSRIHPLRVQYMKHLVLEKLPEWKDKKNIEEANGLRYQSTLSYNSSYISGPPIVPIVCSLPSFIVSL